MTQKDLAFVADFLSEHFSAVSEKKCIVLTFKQVFGMKPIY